MYSDEELVAMYSDEELVESITEQTTQLTVALSQQINMGYVSRDRISEIIGDDYARSVARKLKPIDPLIARLGEVESEISNAVRDFSVFVWDIVKLGEERATLMPIWV